ncbi:MAG: cytochrome c4 [Gammaproteobacteria bacterium]|nr:cytochrome c4 [Gammaproteobacteria bacterium]
MKKVKALQAAMVACGLALTGAVFADGHGGPSAEALSYSCAGCHGTNGLSSGPASPTLAGMPKSVMIETMQGFKSGDIPATIMGRIAKGYTDAEIEKMGDFFAKQKFMSAQQSSDAMLAKKGAKLHDKYCEKCHSEGGSIEMAVEDEVGVLAGQWKPYLHYSLNDFVSGKRPMPKKMKKKLETMHKKEGDAGIQALLEFYAGK